MKCRHCHKEGAKVRGGSNRECKKCHIERIMFPEPWNWIPLRLRTNNTIGIITGKKRKAIK